MSEVVLTSVLDDVDYLSQPESTIYVAKDEKRVGIVENGAFVDVVRLASVILNDGNSSINGMVKIPVEYNGVYERYLIIQWGRTGVVAGDNVVTFNTPFPNSIFNLQATPSSGAGTVGVEKDNLSSFTIKSNVETLVFWFAIGL